MEINIGLILASIVNFLILLFILKHFFFGKVQAVIEERENYINKQIESAEEASERARFIAIDNERAINSIKEEGKELTKKEKQKAEKIYEEIIANAKHEAEQCIERAKKEIDREREKVEYGLKKEAIEIALELSKKVIEQNIDENKNKELIDNFISEIGS